MLFGEHAVVHGRPCLVTAVDQRLTLQLTRQSERSLHLRAPEAGVTDYRKSLDFLNLMDVPRGARFVEAALNRLHEAYGFDFGVRIESRAAFAPTFGFGSSSASAVCTVAGMAALADLGLSEREIFDLAYGAVLDVQGTGSGFDVAAAVYGGTLYFETGGRVIAPVSLQQLDLAVGYSGIKADTVTLVKAVAAARGRNPELVGQVFDEIGAVVRQARSALEQADWPKLGELMNLNQGFLAALDVSCPELDQLIDVARTGGALGAKLSGAGGGDCMIALVADDTRGAVEAALAEVGTPIPIRTHAPGVTLEASA
jgi:mevalonate kinase